MTEKLLNRDIKEKKTKKNFYHVQTLIRHRTYSIELGVLKTALDMTFEGKHTQNSCSRHANFSLQTVKVGISQKHYFLGIHFFLEKKRKKCTVQKWGYSFS